MKLWKVLFIPLLLVGLCGCKQSAATPEQITEHYADRPFRAEYTVTTHAGFYTEYRLACTGETGLSKVTILQPESVAGISAILQGNSTQLQYEELSLDALLPEVPGYAPMDVLQYLLTDLQSTPEFTDGEPGRLTLEYRSTATDGAELLKLVILDAATLDLQSAECYLDGSLIVSLKMESFQWG